MADAWVINILKDYGLAGVVILALASVVIWQSRNLKAMFGELQELHAQRGLEREKLATLLANANEAQRITAEVTAKRNEIMEDIAAALQTQANANDRLGDRVAGQTEMFRDQLGNFRHVVDSFGESNRVMTGLIAEIRNTLISNGIKIDALPATIRAALK